LDKKFNKMKESYVDDMIKAFEELTTFRAAEYNPAANHTSIMQKALKSLF